MATKPLRKYIPMHGSSIDEADIKAGTILASDIATDAVTSDKILALAVTAAKVALDAVGATKIAADAIPDSAAIVKIISPNSFDSAALIDVIADNSFDEATVLALFAAGSLTEANLTALIADNQFTLTLMNSLMTAGALADDRLVSSIVKEPGHVAVGRLDFNATATDDVTVTIGAVTYLEAAAADAPNGEWEKGVSANNSAVSLAAAINGDTRNAGGNSYAAVVLTDTVFVFALAVGTAGNVSMSVSAGEPSAIENLVGGTAAAVKQQAHIMHTVTTLEVAVAGTAPEVLIPLPFDADFFSFQVYDSTGGIYATELTARGTVVAASSPVPAYFRLANNGAADVQVGDIIRLVVQD